ncbi:MAG: hypothetical protein C5B51_07505 [Terriglobia bacterium]|nr:MAG: hypothetical protein C5B51_07505 [Terriglobia bacterium]
MSSGHFIASLLVPVTLGVIEVPLAAQTGGSSSDRLYAGAMSLGSFQALSQVPLPDSPNEKFCTVVRLAPDFMAWAYVPTAAERTGDFSATPAAAQLLDPLTGLPFPGGIIPLTRIPDPYAWRIASSGPAIGERCMQAPALPQFNKSYYVTGREAQSDALMVDHNSLIGTVYQIGDPFPADQVVNIFNPGPPVDFLVAVSNPNNNITNRWLKIVLPPACCQTPNSIRFSIQPVGLRAGFYGVTVSVIPVGAIGPAVPIDVGVFVQTPANWIVVDPPSLQFTYQPGGSLPAAQSFRLTLPSSRSYFVNTRVVSPRSGNWLSVSSTGGTGPATITVFITNQATALPPGSYMAVVDITAGAPVILPALAKSVPQAGSSGLVCGGALSQERLAIFLDVGRGPITVPNLGLDSDGRLVLPWSYVSGAAIQQPPNVTFQPIGGSSDTYDVNFILRNPGPAYIPPSGWLNITASSSTLPIIVTPTLDPIALGTLPPCDYEGYISVSNNRTGAIVKIKLTLTPTDGGTPPANVTRIMSQIADGGAARPWKTTIILVNTDVTQTVPYQLTFHPGHGLDGQPISPDAPFNVVGPGQAANRVYAGNIQPGGSVILPTRGPGAPFWQGWAELTAPDSVGGTAIFAQALDNTSDAEGSVLLQPPAGPTFFLPFDNISGKAVTTMALVNTSASATANVTVKFHNESGQVFSQSSVPLARSGHEAFALTQRFPQLADTRGVAEFISDGPPLAGLGLRFNQQQSTFSSFEITTPQAGGTRQAIAHIPDGGVLEGAWKTSITLVNLDPNQTNSVVLKFHNGQDTPPGQALALENGQLAGNGTYTLTLGPGGSTTVATRGQGGSPLWQGWAEVVSSTALGGFAVFRQALRVGLLEGTVSFTPLGSARFVVPFDNTRATGVAIVNTSDQGATLNGGFRDPGGNGITGVGAGQRSLTLEPGTHRAFSLSDPQAPLGGRALGGINGIADVTSTWPGLIGIGLRFSPRNAFTSLPIILK